MAKRLATVGPSCVACGACEKVCPDQAIKVYNGITARVDPDRCIGCGKCARECPAGIISLITRDETQDAIEPVAEEEAVPT